MQSDLAHQLCRPIQTPRLLLSPVMGSHADAAFGPMQDDATAGNHASAQVLKEAGFSYTRILPENDILRGEPVDDGEYVRAV